MAFKVKIMEVECEMREQKKCFSNYQKLLEIPFYIFILQLLSPVGHCARLSFYCMNLVKNNAAENEKTNINPTQTTA